MARAGEEIYNPVQNDWIVFRETTQDTSGQLLSAELVVAPRGGGTPLHVHPNQEEHFKVLSGTLGVQVGEEHRSLGEERRRSSRQAHPTDGGTTPTKRPVSYSNYALR